jgi:hypothetical protein
MTFSAACKAAGAIEPNSTNVVWKNNKSIHFPYPLSPQCESVYRFVIDTDIVCDYPPKISVAIEP